MVFPQDPALRDPAGAATPIGPPDPKDWDEALCRAIDSGRVEGPLASDPELQKAVAAHHKLEALFELLREPAGLLGGINDDLTPERIGRFVIRRVLGKGTFGTVYLADDPELSRPVAIKVPRRNFNSSAEVDVFLAEARHAAGLKHASIVAVHDVGRDGLRPYIVLEYIAGRTLQEVRPERLPHCKVAGLLADVADALNHAHQRGFVHRDLKPGNILVDEQGRPHVADFGLAVTETTQRQLAGQIAGTPAYMSPEQVRGEAQRLDGRADIWSLGVIAYQLLTGRLPFSQDDAMALLDDIQHREPKPPRQIDDTIPSELERIVLRCLAKSLTNRYPAAADVAADLRRWLVMRGDRSRRRATAFAAVLTFVVLAVLAATAAIGVSLRNEVLDKENIARGERLVSALLNSDIEQVPSLVAEITPYRKWADPLLIRAFHETKKGSAKKLHAALALLPVDDRQIAYLSEQLLSVSPGQFPVVRDALAPHRSSFVEQLWARATNPENGASPRFQAACALAVYAPDDERWSQVGPFVTGHLCALGALELLDWRTALRPAANQLLEPLASICRTSTAPKQVRVRATETLADFAADDPDQLFDVLADAEPFQFDAIYGKLKEHHHRAVALSTTELAAQPADDARKLDKERLAKRQANAAGALIRLGATDQAWPLLRASPDPLARSFFIHRFGPMEGDPQAIIQQIRQEPDVTIRRALVLALGEFSDMQMAQKRPELIERLLSIYELEPDAGLRSAAEWLLRKWGEGERLKIAAANLRISEEKLMADEAADERQWYVNFLGQTMVILDAGEWPGMGQGGPIDDQRGVKTRRRIAMASHEVTIAQFTAFQKSCPEIPKNDTRQWVMTDDSPEVTMNWFEAAAFCNWLSEKAGIPECEWCYERIEGSPLSVAMRAKPSHWALRGYRLPSKDEWQEACRAGTVTSRYYGEAESLLESYAWYRQNGKLRTWPVGSLKPNDAGLFDMLGNVAEFCDDWDGNGRPWMRGGAFDYESEFVDSVFCTSIAPSDRFYETGIRVVRTIAGEPPAPAIAPFDAKAANCHEQVWARQLRLPVEVSNSVGMTFRLIPPGEFLMGSPQPEIDEMVRSAPTDQVLQDCCRSEGPQHRAQHTKAFYLGIHEVTQKQYQDLMAVNPSGFSPTGSEKETVQGLDTSQHPVDRISWFDAVDFCNKLSEKEGLPLFYSRQGDSVTLQGGGGYRLPTEAEWEFACRAGTTTRWSFGDNDQVAARYAWIESAAAGRPHRAGELAANSFGLLDMDGNVWEWCCDWYGNYAAVDQRDPSGPVAGSKRVLRGGSFATSPWIVRSAVRNGDLPTIQYSHFGFRVARTCN